MMYNLSNQKLTPLARRRCIGRPVIGQTFSLDIKLGKSQIRGSA